jgi:hypothetical protein
MGCWFLTPVDCLDRIEAMERSLPSGDSEGKHGTVWTLTPRLADLSGPLTACERDVAALPAHAVHEKFIINLERFLKTFFNRRQLDRSGATRFHRGPRRAHGGCCTPARNKGPE